MMIPTITDYLYHIHHFKLEISMEIKKKRAVRFLCILAVIVTGCVLAWILY
jgi:hypothetical protein